MTPMLAVVPGLFAPFQSLLSFLPQIAIALVAAATALFRPQVYRWAWTTAKSHRAVSATLAVLILGGAAGGVAWSRAHRPWLPPPPEEAKRDGWWCFRLNSERTGSDGSAVGGSVRAIWKFRDTIDRAAFSSSPAFWAGRIYVGCDNDAVYCFDAATGRDPLWTFPTRYPVFAPPVVANGRMYTGEGLHHNTDARLYCADAVTGKKLWQFQTTSHVEYSGTVAEGRIYFGAGDDGVYCLDAETGAKIWQAKGRHVDQSPLVVRGLVIVGVGYGETGVMALRASDGQVVWSTKLPSSAWGEPALGPRGVIVGIGNANFEKQDPDPKAELLCLSLDGGGVVWRTPLTDSPLGPAAVSGDRAFLGDFSGDFSCFDVNTGRKIWTAGCGRPVLTGAAIAKDAVVFSCNGGHVHAVRPENGGEIWRYDATKDVFSGTDCRFFSSPAVVGGRVYVGCNNFYFYCLGEK